EVGEDLIVCHAAREIFQHITYRDAHAPDTWLSITDARINGDDLGVVHAGLTIKDKEQSISTDQPHHSVYDLGILRSSELPCGIKNDPLICGKDLIRPNVAGNW